MKNILQPDLAPNQYLNIENQFPFHPRQNHTAPYVWLEGHEVLLEGRKIYAPAINSTGSSHQIITLE
jgi:hypothetical protein